MPFRTYIISFLLLLVVWSAKDRVQSFSSDITVEQAVIKSLPNGSTHLNVTAEERPEGILITGDMRITETGTRNGEQQAVQTNTDTSPGALYSNRWQRSFIAYGHPCLHTSVPLYISIRSLRI